MSKLLRVNEVAKEIGETAHIVRNWMREFKEYLPLEKSESGYNLYSEDAVAMMRKIKQLAREQKYSVRQIEHYLSTGGELFGSLPEETDNEKKLDEILARLHTQDEFNKALLKQLEEQNKNFETFVHDRDQKLMIALREIRETKQLQPVKKWYEVWK